MKLPIVPISIACLLLALLLISCTLPNRSSEGNRSEPPPLKGVDAAVNDRRTWMDGPGDF